MIGKKIAGVHDILHDDSIVCQLEVNCVKKRAIPILSLDANSSLVSLVFRSLAKQMRQWWRIVQREERVGIA